MGPPDERLEHWMHLYHRLTERNGAQANAGRWLPAWVRAAGFTELQRLQLDVDVRRSAGREWWGQLWADRVQHSSFATQAKEHGFADEAQLADIADAFESWAAAPDGVFVVVHVEVLARTPSDPTVPESHERARRRKRRPNTLSAN